MAVANTLLDILGKRSEVATHIDRLQAILDRGYIGNGRNARKINPDKISQDIQNEQLRLKALNSDVALFVDKLNSGFADTVVPDHDYIANSWLASEAGGVGPAALVERAIFLKWGLPYSGITGPQSVAGPEMVLGAGFAGFMGSGLRAGIEAAIDEAIGVPVSWVKGKAFPKTVASEVDDVAPIVLKPDPNVIRSIKALPDGAKLSHQQITELSKNIDVILKKTLPAKAASGRVDDVINLFRNDTRFRFLDQVPGGQARIEEALEKFGASL